MMETSCAQFIEKLMATSDILQKTGNETIVYWEPDLPPTIILFAAIGRGLARNFDDIDNERKRIVFKYIEEAMNASDKALKTAVATGIIESLASETALDTPLWRRIELQLGHLSRHHSDAWRHKL